MCVAVCTFCLQVDSHEIDAIKSPSWSLEKIHSSRRTEKGGGGGGGILSTVGKSGD